MAAVLVQSALNQGTAASLAVGSAQGWAAPTAGNLIVAWADSDATVTVNNTMTLATSVVDGNGAYLWYKFATGTETSFTFTPSISDTIIGGLLEYSGVASFDAIATPFQSTGVDALSAGPASVTGTGTSGDLVIAVGALHENNGQTLAPTAPSWTNSFTNRQSSTVGTINSTPYCAAFVADFQNTSAATVSTTLSWSSGQLGDRQLLLAAFKLSAGGGGGPSGHGIRSRVAPMFRRTPRDLVRTRLAHGADFGLPVYSPPASLVSTLDSIATNNTAPTTGNSNISATANNTAPTLFASTDLGVPHFGATTQKYTQTVGTAAAAVWDTTKWTSPPTGFNVYNRFYLYMAAVPGSTIGVTALMNAAFTASSSVRVTSGNRLTAYATSSVQLGTMTTVMPTAQWVRVESKTFMDVASGVITIRLYLNPESTTFDEEYVSPVGNTLNAQTGIQRVGLGNIGSGSTATHYFADAAWSDTDWIGPLPMQRFIGWGWGVTV